MADWTKGELQAALAEVARRSTIDPAFRALALNDGSAAIAKVANGKAAPPDQSYRFVENSGDVKVIALPDQVPDLEELSEAELVAIAGGDVKVQGEYKYTPTGPVAAVGGAWTR